MEATCCSHVWYVHTPYCILQKVTYFGHGAHERLSENLTKTADSVVVDQTFFFSVESLTHLNYTLCFLKPGFSLQLINSHFSPSVYFKVSLFLLIDAAVTVKLTKSFKIISKVINTRKESVQGKQFVLQ